MSGWIRTIDRLPTADDRTVAVLLDGQDPCVAWATYWSGARTDFAEWTFPMEELGEGRRVTHWMPLPPPPTD